MNSRIRKLILASAIGVALTIGSAVAANPSPSQDVLEARQEAQIWTTYMLSPYLRANDINVTVDAGKATLTGVVDEDVNRDLAKQIALGVSGIDSVDNQIVIREDYVPPTRTSSRSYADVVEDANVTTAVKSRLAWNAQTHGMDTQVSTLWGKVTLTGAAETSALKSLAGQITQNTRGVQSVDNQLRVDGRRAPRAGATAASKSNALADGWITTKIKSTYMYSTNVNSSNIDVSTTDGIVTLKGKVASGAEQALAIELAKNTRGVKGVRTAGLTH